MSAFDKRPAPASIYDWLEKPVMRTPGFKRPYPEENDMAEINQVNEVDFYPEIILPGSKSVGNPSFDEGTSVYNISIPPMLQPQMNQPEFFMNNHSKAMMAQKGISTKPFDYNPKLQESCRFGL